MEDGEKTREQVGKPAPRALTPALSQGARENGRGRARSSEYYRVLSEPGELNGASHWQASCQCHPRPTTSCRWTAREAELRHAASPGGAWERGGETREQVRNLLHLRKSMSRSRSLCRGRAAQACSRLL